MSTGLNFQTCTIINSNIDVNGVAGKNWLFKAFKKGEDNKLTEATSSDKGDLFRVKRDFWFEKSKIKSVRRANADDPKMTKVTIDFSKLLTSLQGAIAEGKKYGFARIDINLGLEGSEEFLYANPWILKGMPLWVDVKYTSSDNEKDIAKRVETNIKKGKNFLVDHQLINVSSDNGVLTLEGADEFQRIRNVKVVVYNAYDENDEVIDLLDGYHTDGDAIKLVEFGKNGFGTYSYLIRNVQIPTLDNVQPYHLRSNEMPIVGAKYDQFIINYADDAPNDGLMCVGERPVSHTQHVFWVNQTVSNNFATELANADITVTNYTKPTDKTTHKESTDPGIL